MYKEQNSENKELKSSISHEVHLSSTNGATEVSFDLNKIKMTNEQEAIVLKLFKQNPIAYLTDSDHSHENEKGLPGPGSKYLNSDEFEIIRHLGVRLGTKGELTAAVCDFCLHCVKVEPLQNWHTDEVV
jgi:hypothetical protein